MPEKLAHALIPARRPMQVDRFLAERASAEQQRHAKPGGHCDRVIELMQVLTLARIGETEIDYHRFRPS